MYTYMASVTSLMQKWKVTWLYEILHVLTMHATACYYMAIYVASHFLKSFLYQSKPLKFSTAATIAIAIAS